MFQIALSIEKGMAFISEITWNFILLNTVCNRSILSYSPIKTIKLLTLHNPWMIYHFCNNLCHTFYGKNFSENIEKFFRNNPKYIMDQDRIPAYLNHDYASHLAPPLAFLFNLSLQNSIFPDVRKIVIHLVYDCPKIL